MGVQPGPGPSQQTKAQIQAQSHGEGHPALSPAGMRPQSLRASVCVPPCPEERGWEDRSKGDSAALVHGRAGKALGNGTSADPVLAKGCSAAPTAFGPGPWVSNMRHGAGERKQRRCGRRRAKRKLGGTWNAGLTALHCALGGERGETAPAGQRAEGRAALLTSMSESSPPH